ncbi:uncharacterized protein Dyak_GE23866, isoform B [Drosophila yakuba]|uniref:Uncharacterized protein, isoform B n=1 Tax=Drosophila yakuba TaxID=7245 RepID=A0A0R1E528_DROYA|nr:uncharacterized protein Dyak_GE23866, isoform B [Drosophila yakuba]
MLLYTKELVAPRPRPGLLRFRNKPPGIKFRERLRCSFAQSTIPGMQHVFGERHLWQRCLWLTIVLGAVITGFSLYTVLRHRHSEQLLVSLIETTQLPVYHIDFPAVAVCPWSHFNWQRAPSALHRFLPRHPDAELRETFRQLLASLDIMNFSNFNRIRILANRNLTGISYLKLTDVMNYMTYRCDELFVADSCVFDETPYDCCQLFVREQTVKGQCLVFNSMISEHSQKKHLTNKFYPYKLSTAGEESGLKFTINASFSFMNNNSTHVPFGMNNERNPGFHNTSLTYNRENCLAVCLHLVVLKTCQCSMPAVLPPIEGVPECGIKDAKCLGYNSDIFTYVKVGEQEKYINDSRQGHFCDCPDNCNSRQYKMSLNVRKLDYPKNSTERLIKAQVYYGQRVMTKIITKLKYTNIDLLANFGGIISLYIGASVMSFIEFSFVVGKLMWVFFKDARLKLKEYTK